MVRVKSFQRKDSSFTKDEILTLADKALYEAKKLSRNAVYNAKDLNTWRK